jgi:hypothetical protein
MTDTITRDVVTETISALTITRDRAIARLGAEEEAYLTKRNRMVRIAHDRGTANSIGSALDDLLEEFDLPRRGPSGYLRALVMVYSPVTDSTRTRLTLASGGSVYVNERTRVGWPLGVDHSTSSTSEETCLCDDPVERVRSYLQAAYGNDVANQMTFQIGAIGCTLSTCPNKVGGSAAYFSETSTPTRPWHEVPMHTVVVPGVAATS